MGSQVDTETKRNQFYATGTFLRFLLSGSHSLTMQRLVSLVQRKSNVSLKPLTLLNTKSTDEAIQENLNSLLPKRFFGKRAPPTNSAPTQKPNKGDILKLLQPSHRIPLDQKFPGAVDYPVIASNHSYQKDPPTYITTLPNGIRVATEEVHSPTASISIVVDAGVKYEDDKSHGASRFLERMAFKVPSRSISSRCSSVSFIKFIIFLHCIQLFFCCSS